MARTFLSLALLAVMLGSPVKAQEVPRLDAKEGELKRFIDVDSKDVLTKLEVLQHSLFLAEQKLTNLMFMIQYCSSLSFEKVLYRNYDNDFIPGYVIGPKVLEKGRKYPALVAVHGGYHLSFSDDFFVFMKLAVDNGYIVIFPEYRGSKGYGAEHYNAIDYGGKEVDDVLAAVDYLAEFRPYVDKDKLAIVGWSHGGMITLLAIERAPKRFQCAVDIVGLADFVTYMSYKPDYRRQDVARQPRFKGLPFEKLGAYMDVSPINHVEKIEIPLFVVATTGDKIVPIQLHALRLIDVLKAKGKKFEYKIYDNAPGGHSFTDGDTKEARDAHKRIFEFIGRNLR
jgi:dipeptidyl aminopeptidase/acylaminoacyl peptidase